MSAAPAVRPMTDKEKEQAREATRRRLKALGLVECDPKKTLESAAQFYRRAQSDSDLNLRAVNGSHHEED